MACVAVVDDDPVFVDLMRDALQCIGLQALPRLGSQGTHEAIRDAKPDLVILDIWLERPESGWALLEALRSDPQTERIPVVLTSADRGQLVRRERWLSAPNIRVLPKPFDLDQLDELVGALLPARVAVTSPLPSSSRVLRAPVRNRDTQHLRVLYRAPIRGWRIEGLSRREQPGELMLTPEKLVLTAEDGAVEHILISSMRITRRGVFLHGNRVYVETPRRALEISCGSSGCARELVRRLVQSARL